MQHGRRYMRLRRLAEVTTDLTRRVATLEERTEELTKDGSDDSTACLVFCAS